jgi:hypothetical protein
MRLRRPGRSASPRFVSLDDERVTRLGADGTASSMRWADLVEVRMASRPARTLSEGVRFVLVGARGEELDIPRPEATQDFIDRLQALPGFDTEALIQAIGSWGEGEWICWRAEGPRKD